MKFKFAYSVNWQSAYRACGFIALLFAVYSVLQSIYLGTCNVGCDVVAGSKYSKLFAIPVGVYAILAWIWILSDKLNKLRIWVLGVMTAGAAGFVILLYTMHAVCWICLGHHISCALTFCFAYLHWRKSKAEAGVPPVRILPECINILKYAAVLALVWVSVPHGERVYSTSNLRINFPIMSGAQVSEVENGHIMSLTCKWCYMALERVIATPRKKPEEVNIIFHCDSKNLEITVATLATILQLHKKGDFKNLQECNARVFSLLFKHRENLIAGKHTEYLAELKKLAQPETSICDMAGVIISSHTMFISENKAIDTPLEIKNHKILKRAVKKEKGSYTK